MSLTAKTLKPAPSLLWHLALIALSAAMLIPFFWMITTSLKPGAILKIRERWIENWLPGEDVVWVDVDGNPLRVKKIGQKDGAALVRVIETGPRDGARIRLPLGAMEEEDVTLVREGDQYRLRVNSSQSQPALGARLFRTGSKSGDPVSIPAHILDSGSKPPAALEEGAGWLAVRELRRDEFTIEWQATDNHPRFGQQLAVAPGDVHEEWRVRFAWGNYKKAWDAVNLGRGYGNSLFVALLVTLGQVFTSSLAAYAFARLRFLGRDALFLGYLGTMMIPAAVTMIPVYILFARGPAALDALFHTAFFTSDLYLFRILQIGKPLGIDSYMALILPAMFSAYGTFMLRQFFMSIPGDLEDAARIDGCGAWGIYRNVVLPLSRPALATLAIFTFIGTWKGFMWPLIVCQSEPLRTLPVVLSQFQDEYNTEYHLLMAGSLMSLVPVIIVFILGQRHFVAGIRLGAVKG